MNGSAQQFPYVARDPSLGSASLAPMLPLTLVEQHSVTTSGLVDSGASVNVLPFSLGEQVGLDWDQQTQSVELSGNLASVEARVVVLSAIIGNFSPVRLAFAWAETDDVSVILGQVNFFLTFDICFFSVPKCVRGEGKTVGELAYCLIEPRSWPVCLFFARASSTPAPERKDGDP